MKWEKGVLNLPKIWMAIYVQNKNDYPVCNQTQ